RRRLRGVLAFTPTPFTQDDRLDGDGLAHHVDFLCRSGAHVVVVCGGAGEFFSLDLDEYRTAIRIAVEAVARRVPVLAGIGFSTRVACGLAEHAESVGADGLMINPMYFVEASDDGIVRHYQALSRATRLGMMVYSTKGSVATPAIMRRLAEIDAVVALKDEYGDLKTFGEMVEEFGERLAWVNGMAELLAAPYFAAGAQAFTSGIVNFASRFTLAVWEAGAAGRWEELHALVAQKIRPLAVLRERRKGYAITVVKEAMNLLGLPGGAVRSPLVPLAAEDRADLRKVLIELDLLHT
ncbi:MAG: dihydrodipicolinate synthase family protein, partial [Armatimonadota bacterium]